MGRKIPAKRHRGVKDPLEQQARREKSLKCKINAPPKDPDEQPIPCSLTRLFAFQQDKQHLKPNTNKHNKRKQGSKVEKKERSNPVSSLRRLPGESGRSFSLRINSAVRALQQDVAPAHYPEEVETEDVKGERMAARRDRKRRRAAAAAPTQESLTRSQKLALKKKTKKERADDLKALERREVQHEVVPFGEVAHGPPALRGAAPRPRPAARPLLLTALLAGAGGGGGGGAEPAARLQAVAAYRLLKRQRRRDDTTRR